MDETGDVREALVFIGFMVLCLVLGALGGTWGAVWVAKRLWGGGR